MSDRKSDLEKFRNYFYGNVSALHSGFLERFKDPEVTQPLSIQNFVCQNEIRAIIEKRISLIPLSGVRFFVFDPDEQTERKELTGWLNSWLEGPNFGNGRSYLEFMAEMLLCLELDGESPLKLILRNGTPKIRLISDEAFEIVASAENIFDVESYVARWTYDIEGEDYSSQVQIKETIDANKYILETDGKAVEQAHKFGFIPVVLIRREDQEGCPHGRSGVDDLIEPQENLNRCLTNIARANKYGPWGLYCTEESGVPLPEGDVTVGPGSLVAAPIKKVSGDGAADCLFTEKEQILDAMYRIAGLSRNKTDEIAMADRTSAKALIVLNAQGKRYVENLIARLKRGISKMCRYSMVMASKIKHEDGVKVLVEFPSLDTEDPASQLERARLLFEIGLEKEALRTMGYEDEKIENILTERQGAKTSFQNLNPSEFDA